MEAIFKIKASEMDNSFLESIRKLFKEKEIIIKISSSFDETEFLSLYPSNVDHIIANMNSESEVKFSGDEFQNYVKQGNVK